MRRLSLVLITCFLLVVSVVPAGAAPPSNPAGLQRVIVQLRPNGPAPQGLAAQFAQSTAFAGGRIGAVYEHALKGFAAELPQAAIDALLRNPNVLSVTPDQIVSIAEQDVPTGFDRIEADLAPAVPTSATGCPAGETCTNVDIAIIDTGSNAHPDLNVVHRVDCSSLFASCTDNAGYDGHGHGTHVAGIAAAFDNGDGVVGVAPGARIWSVKVLGDEGTGFLTSLIAGIDWVTARAAEIEVANMSLAGAFNDASFDTAISNSVAAGITYAVAAGNDGVDAAGTSPANHPDVITVSALADGDAAGGGLGKFLCRNDQTDDRLATFSNFGTAVDIAAPGVCIRSTWNDGGFATKSGTSMASPYVAGAAARYLAMNPGADPATVKADLIAGGIPQADPAGFSGDPDGLPEPLLFVNGSAFGGTGEQIVAVRDVTPPPAPLVEAEADGYAIDVSWSPVADPDSGMMAYRVRRDNVQIAEVDHVTSAWREAGEPGTTYSYEVSAVNRQGVEGPRSAVATATTSSANPSDAGWWALDDGTGTTAADGSAWRRPATLVNNPSWETTGRVGGSLRLPATDQRLDLDASILDGFGDITATMWLKTGNSQPQALISGANPGNSNEYLLYLVNPTTLRLYTGGSATTGVSWNLPYSIADGAWHHLAVIRNDTSNRADLYLNGSVVGAWGVSLTTVDISAGGLVFGQEQDSVGGGFNSGQAFVGTLDDLRLYTRVLTAGEIEDLADVDVTPPGPPTGLAATADLLRIDLSWAAATDAESGISAYEIWRGTGAAKTLLATIPGTETGYPDARTSPATAYFYEVRAVNGAGLTGPSSAEAGASTTAGSGDPTLMGWWELDEGAGATAADSSDYGLDATLRNNPGWTTDGRGGSALTFDGTNWVDLDAQILDGATEVTAALWVNTTKTYIQALVSGANSGNDAEYELVLLSNPDLRLRFYTGETNTTYVWWPVPEIADGTWHHLAVTRDSAADRAVLYVDGVSQGSRTAAFEQLTVDWGGLLFGQEQDSVGGWNQADQAFAGSLDDLRLYRRLLSDIEIADLAGTAPPVDTTPPVITLVGDNPMVVEGGDAYGEPGASAFDDVDGDLSAAVVIDNSAVDTTTVGDYPVTYDVSDAAGNPAVQVIRTVEVVDTTPPVITLTGDPEVVVEVDSSYRDAGATAADIVDGDVTLSILVGTTVNIGVVGTYTVTYDVSDAAGNAAVQVVRTVEVVDTTPPVITLLGNPLVTVEGGDPYDDAGASASDTYDGNLTAAITTVNPVDTGVVGTYVVTYDVLDAAGNAAVQVVRTVEVVDTTAPAITLLGDPLVTVEGGDPYDEPGVTAADIVDGNLSAAVMIDDSAVNTGAVGTYAVTYDVSDAAGNAAVQVVRTVEVVDTTPPVITLTGDPVVTVEVDSTYVDAGATAADIIGGNLTPDIVVSNPVDTRAAGTYLVTYDVSDAAGNAAVQVTRTVEVVEAGGSLPIYVSSTSGGTVGGVPFADEDILVYDPDTGVWSMFLDGSDVGLSGSGARDVDAFELLEDGSILLSFVAATSIPDVGSVDDSDIVRFVPTSLGTSTAGTFEWYFDGSDVGLTRNGEDVDAVTVLADGRIVISTAGGFSVPGVSGADEDLLVFTPASLGSGTSGTWDLYFDGSDVALNNAPSEDVNGTWVDAVTGDVYLTTVGSFAVAGVAGAGADLFVFTPTSLGNSTAGSFAMFWDGSTFGWGSETTDGIHVGG